jgi:hypothetical protein
MDVCVRSVCCAALLMLPAPLWTYLILPSDQLGAALDDLRAEAWR